MKNEMFCDECGSILEVKTTKEGKKFGICNCGFAKEVHSDIISSEIEPKRKEVGEGVIVEETEIPPGFPHTCKKCGYKEAEVYDLGASYSDEANKYLFKCLKCGYTERQADGTGN
ncbi:MAG: hypothetical protein AABX03_04740 [Nanoarchaeota archaeon]